MKFKKTTLSNGLRVITAPMRGNLSAAVMIAVETGSNYESEKGNGLSHFLEHMLFKGTPTRPSALIVSTELDSIGAESNAFTSQEVTAYHAKSERRHWKKLLEIVSDIYLNPTFPESNIEKERGVILQEIAMYNDLPQRKVWDNMSGLLYGDVPAGRPIIGSEENIKSFSRKDFLKYHKKHYLPRKTIVIVAGDIDDKSIVAEVKKIFGHWGASGRVAKKPAVKERQKSPALAVEYRKSGQTHMLMSFRGHPAHDKRSIPAEVVMSVLGDGSSSRLFQRLRNEMGACYYVYTNEEAFTDHSFLSIAIGIDGSRIVEITKALVDECKRLTYEKVGEKELNKAKNFMASHMYMRIETTDALTGYYALEEILPGGAKNPQKYEEEIRRITAEEIMKTAKRLFTDENLNLAVVGNISDTKRLKKTLTFN